MAAAGLVAAEFGLDPVVDVLGETNRVRYAIRLAAFRAVQDERRKAQEDADRRRPKWKR